VYSQQLSNSFIQRLFALARKASILIRSMSSIRAVKRIITRSVLLAGDFSLELRFCLHLLEVNYKSEILETIYLMDALFQVVIITLSEEFEACCDEQWEIMTRLAQA